MSEESELIRLGALIGELKSGIDGIKQQLSAERTAHEATRKASQMAHDLYQQANAAREKAKAELADTRRQLEEHRALSGLYTQEKLARLEAERERDALAATLAECDCEYLKDRMCGVHQRVLLGKSPKEILAAHDAVLAAPLVKALVPFADPANQKSQWCESGNHSIGWCGNISIGDLLRVRAVLAPYQGTEGSVEV